MDKNGAKCNMGFGLTTKIYPLIWERNVRAGVQNCKHLNTCSVVVVSVLSSADRWTDLGACPAQSPFVVTALHQDPVSMSRTNGEVCRPAIFREFFRPHTVHGRQETRIIKRFVSLFSQPKVPTVSTSPMKKSIHKFQNVLASRVNVQCTTMNKCPTY